MRPDDQPERFGAIILCGGRSQRMGVAKALLPFGNETMLQRVVRILSTVADPIVVVAAPGQTLPALPADPLVVEDSREGRGPLEGLRVGLHAIRSHAAAAYVTSCDVPLLEPAFVRQMFEFLEDADAAVPIEDGFFHPLASVYRTTVLPAVERLLAVGQLRPAFLFDVVPTRRIPVAELRHVDPDLRTLKNLNHPADYLQALQESGLPADPNTLQQLNTG